MIWYFALNALVLLFMYKTEKEELKHKFLKPEYVVTVMLVGLPVVIFSILYVLLGGKK